MKRVNGALRNPVRFVFVRRYFGPDRRKRDLAYDGPERRSAAKIREVPLGPPRKSADTSVPLVDEPVQSEERTEGTDGPVPLVEETHAPGPDQGDLAPAAAEDVAAPEAKVTLEADERVSALIEGHQRWLHTGGKDGTKAELTDSDLHGVNLAGVNLSSANLSGANLTDVDLSGANLAGADFRRGDLSNAVVNEANLGVARLRHGTLRFTQLEGANLRGADLAGADLRGAVLARADVEGALLLGANLRETDLSRSVGLVQAQIDRAVLDHTTRLPAGLRLPARDD